MFKKITLALLAIPTLAIPAVASAQSYVVYDFTKNKVLESRSPQNVQPIASVTKLMTANIFLEHNKNPNCRTSITDDDYDYIKGTGSKLPKNTPISCLELLKAMMVNSDNYAAHALARSAGMSRIQFIQKMNEKARQLGMRSTRFHDSSGLSSMNISSAMDLVKLAQYSLKKPLIQHLSNTKATYVQTGRRNVFIQNTNKLVREEIFDAVINKTGYIRESGYNLVFINKNLCNRSMIGVITLNNKSSAQRANFVQSKLQAYGCKPLNNDYFGDSNDYKNSYTNDDADGYDEHSMEKLIQQVR